MRRTKNARLDRTECGWGKVPISVTRDKELSLAARVVFTELASWTGPGRNVVSRGQRAIANAIGIHVETANLAIHELAERNHLRIEGTGLSRRRYILLSPVFRFRVEADGQVVEFMDDGGGTTMKRLVKQRA